MGLKSAGKRLAKKIVPSGVVKFFKKGTGGIGAGTGREGAEIEALPHLIGSRPVPGGPPAILFVNFTKARCGVFQYGATVFQALRNSRRFTFDSVDVESIEEVDRAVAKGAYSAVIINYHPQTLTFLGPGAPRRYTVPCIAVMHEMTQAQADGMESRFFQHYVMGDPTLRENNPGVFTTGRLIPRYGKKWPLPAIPTFGSMGFSVGSKGYGNVVKAVQKEFDQAVIRLHIPANDIIDKDGSQAREFAARCQALVRKPGIRLEFSHEFMTPEALLDFLAQNTLNAFLYDPVPVAGISSTPDHALAVGRPIAITKSIMFRHLAHIRPSICIEDNSLKQIIANGTAPFDHLVAQWSPESLIAEYEHILDRVLAPEGGSFSARPMGNLYPALNDIPTFDYQKMKRDYENPKNALQHQVDSLRRTTTIARLRPLVESGAYRGIPGVKRFNGILDNAARVRYLAAIQDLLDLGPETMVAKIPQANVQQAFVYDSVLKFATPGVGKLLCVGSYDDSACVALKRLGFDIDEVDPAVNGLDLEKFVALPTTRPGSYGIVFSTSVLEHVKDDARFMAQIADLLKPEGVAILTCDYKDPQAKNEKLIPGDHHWYTQRDLLERILPAMKGCRLVDLPQWICPEPDFRFVGYRYTFASFVVRKSPRS